MQTKTGFMNPVVVHVRGCDWQLAIVGVTRVGRDLFIQMLLRGPDVVTAVVRVEAVVRGETARKILETICAWLERRVDEPHAFLEVPGQPRSNISGSPRDPVAQW